jgi:hypothetical protein
MLYDPKTKTLIETNVTGEISDAQLAKLASAIGGKTAKGEPIEMVAVVFMMPGHGEKNLSAMKRFGLECRAFGDDGVERILSKGTRTQIVSARPEGPLVPILREESWPHLASAVHRRLLSGPIAAGPWVTYGWDGPTAVARMAPQDQGERTLEDIDREARANLLARKPKITYRRMGDHTVILSEEYGAEMILVPEIMREVAQQLGTEMMAVGVPTEHGFFATAALDPEKVDVMIRWARDEFDKTQKRRVSPIPFLVDARGELVGLVTSSPPGMTEDAATPGKPWWKFW